MQTQTISATDAKNNFSQILSLVSFQKQHFIVERQGKPIALISPQPIRSKSTKPHQLINQLSKHSLGISSWQQAKKLLDDLHLPS